jgi:hypothetical protein
MSAIASAEESSRHGTISTRRGICPSLFPRAVLRRWHVRDQTTRKFGLRRSTLGLLRKQGTNRRMICLRSARKYFLRAQSQRGLSFESLAPCVRISNDLTSTQGECRFDIAVWTFVLNSRRHFTPGKQRLWLVDVHTSHWPRRISKP